MGTNPEAVLGYTNWLASLRQQEPRLVLVPVIEVPHVFMVVSLIQQETNPDNINRINISWAIALVVFEILCFFLQLLHSVQHLHF